MEPSICREDGCSSVVFCRGWCSKHYTRWQRHGDPGVTTRQPPKQAGGGSCEVCPKRATDLGRFCKAHAQRFRRWGDPLGGGTGDGEPERWAREFAAAGNFPKSCVRWPFSINKNGYGTLPLGGGKRVGAHRFILDLVEPCPNDALHALHAPVICHQPACVNPGHLRWGTDAANVADRTLDGTRWRTDSDTVAGALRMRNEGVTQTEVARRMGVARKTVRAWERASA